MIPSSTASSVSVPSVSSQGKAVFFQEFHGQGGFICREGSAHFERGR